MRRETSEELATSNSATTTAICCGVFLQVAMMPIALKVEVASFRTPPGACSTSTLDLCKTNRRLLLARPLTLAIYCALLLACRQSQFSFFAQEESCEARGTFHPSCSQMRWQLCLFMLCAYLNLAAFVILVVIAFRQYFLARGPHNDGMLILRNVRSNFVNKRGVWLNDADIA